MKIDNYKPKELHKEVKQLEKKVAILKKQESLWHKIKRLLFG